MSFMDRSRLMTILTVLLTGALVASTGDLSSAAGSNRPAERPAAVDPSGAADPASAADAASAGVQAKLTEHRVEVLSDRTATAATFANPDGTFTSEINPHAVRVQNPNGSWSPVDSTLRENAKGGLGPAKAPVKLSLAAKATPTGELATLSDAGRSISLDWPGALPAPQVDQSTAVYRSVAAGVDLRITSGTEGFSKEIILADRSAAAKMSVIKLGLRTAGVDLDLDRGDNLRGTSKDGELVFVAPAAQMWDSVRSGPADEPLNRRAVRSRLTGRNGTYTLELRADRSWLKRSSTAYPVTIDPGVSLARGGWTMVDKGFPTTSYYNSTSEAKAGTYNGGVNVVRPMFAYNLTSIGSSDIIAASLNPTETHSWSCSARAINVHLLGGTSTFGAGTTWNTQPPVQAVANTQVVAKGYSSACPAALIHFDLTNRIRDYKIGGASTGYFELRAGNEGDNTYWKKFANNPTLTVTWNRPPTTPAGSSIAPSVPCIAGAGRPYLGSLTPTLKVVGVDPDGGSVRVQFDLHLAGAGTPFRSYTTGLAASGSTFAYPVPAGVFSNNVSYAWHAKVLDGRLASGWSPACDFTTDVVRPATPTVSSSQYPAGDSWQGGSGVPGTFSFAPTGTSDLAAWVYKLDTADATTERPAAAALNETISNLTEGHRSLSVWAKDRAGNLSESPAVYLFNVGRAGFLQPLEGGTSARRVRLEIAHDPTLTRATYQYRRGPGAIERDIPLTNLTTATGGPIPGPKVPLTQVGSFAVWNVLDTLGLVGGVVQVRAQLYQSDDETSVYATPWQIFAADPNADGAAGDQVGPGSVNLLTGDYTLAETDTDALGLSISRVSSSRDPKRGWVPQGERLSLNQQQVGTDLAGFTAVAATLTRSTILGHDDPRSGTTTAPSALQVNPTGTADSYVALGGDTGGLRLGMLPGRTYRLSAWMYVPQTTGLTPAQTARGLRLVGLTGTPAAPAETVSAKVAYSGGWQQLQVDLAVPSGATDAAFRIYNGFTAATSAIYVDDLSVREVIAPFGPQWTGGPTDAAADSDYQSLAFPDSDVAVLTASDGSYVTFAVSTAGEFFPEPGAEELKLALVTAGVYDLTQADGTVVTFRSPGAAQLYTVAQTRTPDAASTTTYQYTSGTDGRALPTAMINPLESGVGPCTSTPYPRGCEVLKYLWSTSTTATSTALGDYVDRVSAIEVYAWDPAANSGAGASGAITVARYGYDSAGRLREQWDPRISPALKTTYTYDSVGRVVVLKPPGQLPWSFDFGPAGADRDPRHLLRVRRAALQPGSATATDGEIATNVVYDVPLTRAGGGPQDLDATAIGTWAQTDRPTDATAVFGPLDAVTVNTASSTVPGPGGYSYATVHYLNPNGQEVNTLTPGAAIDTTEYDRYGNVVRTLEATDRALALKQLPDAAARLSELGLPPDDAAAPIRALALSSSTRYARTGLDPVETVGPLTATVLEADLVDPDGAKPTLPAGSQVVARAHTLMSYDDNKPDGGQYHLLTTETSGGLISGYPDADTRMTKHGYAAEKGGTSGWSLRRETSQTLNAAADPAEQDSTYTVYDSAGRTTANWEIGATGSDARTRRSVYYTAGANTEDNDCGNRPEYAGLLCVTRAAGAITGAPSDLPTRLPVSRVEMYTPTGQIARAVETADGTTRQSVTQYDAADRPVRQETTGDGLPLPVSSTTYDPFSGQATTTTGDVGTTKEKVLQRGYDALGRLLSYRDASGAVTTTSYDRYSRPVSVADPTGTTAYAYDRSRDPRGLLTGITDSVAGTFGASYGPDGQLTQVTYPGGVTMTQRYDSAKTPSQRTYTRGTGSSATTLFTQSVVSNSQGQWVSDSSSTASATYAYDQRGRLTRATHRSTGTPCETRFYSFDSRTNRTAKASATATEATAACSLTAPATPQNTYSYDSADRLINSGYAYDAFGRTVRQPSGVRNSYYVNDLIAGQTQGDTETTYFLDPAQRFDTTVTATGEVGGFAAARAASLGAAAAPPDATKQNHYGDDSDEPRWVSENPADLNAVTRYVSGFDGDLAASTTKTVTTLPLTNLHGDVSVTLNLATPTAVELHDYDEFGNATGTQARYGWLGGKQRSSETLDGTILMGVRLYHPATGRFLSVDPVYGGSCGAFDYVCANPITNFDINGNCYYLDLYGCAQRSLSKSARGFYKKHKAAVWGGGAAVLCVVSGVGLVVCTIFGGAIYGTKKYHDRTPKKQRTAVGYAGSAAKGACDWSLSLGKYVGRHRRNPKHGKSGGRQVNVAVVAATVACKIFN